MPVSADGEGMRRYLLSALVVVAALGTIPFATAANTRVATQRVAPLEQSILREVNRVRADGGLRPLKLSRPLQSAAAFQSRSLLTLGVFEHDTDATGTFGDRLHRFYPVIPGRAWGAGENLLWSSAGIDAAQAVQIWLDSPPHRKNLLDPTWREFGIAAYGAPNAPGVYAPAGPVVVITLDFGARA
jgi:uncharacterized protein YkwD